METQQAAGIEAMAFSRGRKSLEHSGWYNGTLVTFLLTGEDTQGQFALLEMLGRNGSAPPPHIHHREDEIFYVLEGELTVRVGDRVLKATPGMTVFLPRNVPHSFTIDSEEGRMLVMMSPAGFEGWFKDFSVPAQSMTLPPMAEADPRDIARMLEAAPRYGVEFVMPK